MLSALVVKVNRTGVNRTPWVNWAVAAEGVKWRSEREWNGGKETGGGQIHGFRISRWAAIRVFKCRAFVLKSDTSEQANLKRKSYGDKDWR
jgi:hypothetical protein